MEARIDLHHCWLLDKNNQSVGIANSPFTSVKHKKTTLHVQKDPESWIKICCWIRWNPTERFISNYTVSSSLQISHHRIHYLSTNCPQLDSQIDTLKCFQAFHQKKQSVLLESPNSFFLRACQFIHIQAIVTWLPPKMSSSFLLPWWVNWVQTAVLKTLNSPDFLFLFFFPEWRFHKWSNILNHW